MRYILPVFLICGMILGVSAVHAEMTSSNFQIRWDSFTTGGSDDASSTNFQLRDSTGNQASGNSSATNYGVGAGYRAGVFDQVITYDVQAQNNGSQVSATGLSGTTISVSDSSGFANGDFVVLVQDEGENQSSGVGKIISTSPSDITLDELKTDGGSLTIDGTNDFVYELNGSSANLGTLTDTSVETSVIGFNTSADVDNGYSVQMLSDGLLRDGSNTIQNVADGSVSAGSEEYGARSSDGSIAGSSFDSQDSAITQDFQPIATENENIFESRHFLTLKAAIDSSTLDGSYGQTLTVIVSGNY